MIENAMVAGICSMGVDALVVGPLPTPGVSFITRSLRADAGVVISASHNPYQDNGIKFFGADGYKLDHELEQRIEYLIASGELDSIRPTKTDVGKAYRIDDALGRYVEYAKHSFPKGMTLEGLRIVLDCANGAAYKAAPCILRELGADIVVYNNEPDGTNINEKCGSTYPEEIRKAVIENNADVGIALDGDGDRVIMADENAREVDGDVILAIIAKDWKERDILPNNSVVMTTISNLGVEKSLNKAGITVFRSDVGDRNVIYTMKKNAVELGGEPCGHIIVHHASTTGDGMMSALQVLAVMKNKDISLGKLVNDIEKYPCVSSNIKVSHKVPLDELPRFQAALKNHSGALGSNGRIVTRYSGTENKLRLLVEGRDERQISKVLHELSDVAQREIEAVSP